MLGVESNKFRMRNRLINSFLYYPIDFLLKLPVCVCVCVCASPCRNDLVISFV